MPIEQVLTSRQFGEIFHVKPETVCDWVRKGYINPISNTKPYKFVESEVVKRQKQKRTINIFA
jgi:predicted site-specific integrase-resolvase